MKTLKLDQAFSRWVRISNIKNGKVKCFTCPVELDWREIQNGHFMPRDNMMTRFSEIACKPQCSECNLDCHYHGEKQAVFEKNLRELYGDAIIDELILSARQTKKWTQWEIDEMEKDYLARIASLQTISE